MDDRNPLKRPSGVDVTIEEQRQPFGKLENIIKEMGDIKQIIKSKDALLSILTSNVDRHLLCALFDEINREIAIGTIEPSDLTLLRSGWLVEQIINLESLVNQKGRLLFPFEIGDKLNYVTLLGDVPTLNATYANPKLIDAMKNAKDSKMHQQLYFWSDSSLPLETMLRSAEEFLKAGETDFGMRILTHATGLLQENREREERKKREEQQESRKR